MKKLVSVLLVVVMTLSLLSMTACGDKKIEGSEGIAYTLSEDGTYYICSGLGTCTDKDVVIGNWHNDLPVKELGEFAVSKLADGTAPEVDSVTISEGIELIGFVSCGSSTAKRIVFPDSAETLGVGCMIFCQNLKEVVISKGTKYISADVFMKASEDVTIYYRGSEAEWKEIEIDPTHNEFMDGYKIVYNYKG